MIGDVRCALYDRQLDAAWHKFWTLARDVKRSVAVNIIQDHDEWRIHLRVRTLTGSWQPLSPYLAAGPDCPGPMVAETAILALIWGSIKRSGCCSKSLMQSLHRALWMANHWTYIPISLLNAEMGIVGVCRRVRTRQQPYLSFDPVKTSGPLKVLEFLSEEGTARYTEALLNLPATYNNWINASRYTDKVSGKSRSRRQSWKHCVSTGGFRTGDDIRELAAGLGSNPNPLVLRWLLDHPQARGICQAFGIQGAERGCDRAARRR